MSASNVISPALLPMLLVYRDQDGALMWKERPLSMFQSLRACRSWNVKYAGKRAFTSKDTHGYFIGGINGRPYSAHRVVWALVHGEWPVLVIDHVNGDKCDNRISNLRCVSQADNCRNQKLRSTNSSGVTGVYWSKKARKWQSSIFTDGATRHLGYFDSIECAAAARIAAQEKYGFHPNHGRSDNFARPSGAP